MKTDNYTSKYFEDVNTQAHKSLGCDIYRPRDKFSFYIFL